ncbi:MAG: hypothetical protein Q7S83_00470 [bacterium]|nr:hypothetical protein [bacterium]
MEHKKPEDIDKEAVELFKKEDEKAVDELHEALKIDGAVKLMAGYIEKGFLTHDEPLIQALEKLEKKKFELIGIDPDEAEEDEDKPPS